MPSVSSSRPERREQPRREEGDSAGLGRWSRLRQAVRGLIQQGVSPVQSIDVNKRIRLCNGLALLGAAIMGFWVPIEAAFGDPGNITFEGVFLLGFALVPVIAGRGHHRAARLGLLAVANACVTAGALLFSDAGGNLPFFALAALPLLLFGPDEWRMIAAGAAAPVLLFALCQSGVLAQMLGLHPRLAPPFYLAANALSAFVVAFLVPFSFYRSNLRAETALARAGQERLKRVIDSDLIGVVRGRLSGGIEDANATFLGLLGYSREDLRTGVIDLRSIAPSEICATLAGQQGTSPIGGGPSLVFERTCCRKDGTTVPTLVGVARLDDTDDEVIGFVLDVSAQKHVQAQRELIADRDEALRLRDLFNSIASHELKTPLTALMLNLRLLRCRLEKGQHDGREGERHAGQDGRGTTDGTGRRMEGEPRGLFHQIGRCETAAHRMSELVDALLDVAQMHDGRLKLTRHETDVVEAVERVVNGFDSDRADSIVVRADGPIVAPLDRVRFEQVVTNLLSNAVKYGNGNPIEVRVERDAAANVARLEVIDTGPGIEADMLAHVFEPFQRASAARPIPGLGLGLYVVKMIVEGHGGHVEVDSQPGNGARFVVDVPCSCAPEPPAA
jgi:PAS domain S-box-containing protein